MQGTPRAEVEIDEALIAGLVASQAADFAGLPLEIVGEGWDTVTARLGDEHAVRVPRRAMAAEFIVHEQRWLPVLAPMLAVGVPAPVFVGRPDDDYPWTWSIVPWFEGTTAEHEPLADLEAGAWGEFLGSMRVQPPSDAPINPYRGCPLASRSQAVLDRWSSLRDSPVGHAVDGAITIWQAGAETPVNDSVTWGHGDLHVRNVITRHTRLAAVIDWIDIYAGDPATDLASAWVLFPPDVHQSIWDAYGPVDAAIRRRARAWAIAFAAMYVRTGLVDDPGFLALGLDVTQRVLEAD